MSHKSTVKINEILVLHHSHLDVGYTHTQPILWELQREYIDQALELLDETRGWPEGSRPKWTCEVTAPLLMWLDTASTDDIARFREYVRQDRLGISAMEYNTTPLCNAEQLVRQLLPAKGLREMFGATINTLIQHDVNGVPWPMVDLMLDSGIELLIMGTNDSYGNAVQPRPGVFRWIGPSGRSILVMNGNQYTMFDQLLYAWENDLDRMEYGLAEYLPALNRQNYPFDFLYLTATNTPRQWDNAAPNPESARLVRQWNESGRHPSIRYVTPRDLLERLRQIPADQIPSKRGDWTDWWNFGCSSTAEITRINRRAKRTLFTADLLTAAQGGKPSPAIGSVSTRAWSALNCYDEHTWSYWNPDPALPPMAATQLIKSHFAVEAAELAEYLLSNQLESLAKNPAQSGPPTCAMLVNTSAQSQVCYIEVPVPKYAEWTPEILRRDFGQVRSNRFSWEGSHRGRGEVKLCGPVTMEPYSWKIIPLSELPDAAMNPGLEIGETYIESPHHRLAFDAATGRIHSLYDKHLKWEALAQDGKYGFFEYIRERMHPRHGNDRNTFWDTKFIQDKMKFHENLWNPEWEAIYDGTTRLVSCVVERYPGRATLVRQFEAPGVEQLVQRITLHSEKPIIDLDVSFKKLDDTAPEGIYFTFPLNLPSGWRSHFDTAGMPVALDDEQLPGACRDWVTVESFVSIHSPDHGVTLFSPDAPMVQAGGFNFARVQSAIPRNANPLLLAWVMNNYWFTNFPLSQPGYARFHFALATHGAFDPAHAMADAQAVMAPVLQHPAFEANNAASGKLIELTGEGVHLNYLKLAENGKDTVVRLINLLDRPAEAILALPSRNIAQADLCNPLEESIESLSLQEGKVRLSLPPGCLQTFKLMV